MTFSLEDQIKALERIGYEIRRESVEIVDDPFLNGSYSVCRVFYKGSEIGEWAGLGSRRVEFVFREELQKRMLELFGD